MMNPRITLIHATPLSIQPIEQAFADDWPDVELVNILEDSLSRDRDREGYLSDRMYQRFEDLGDYAASISSQGILFTCSAFAEAIERVQRKLSIPVLKPNEAMLEIALEHGANIAILATFPATVDSMSAELKAMAAEQNRPLNLQIELANGAMQALAAGDPERHDTLIKNAAKRLNDDADVVLLAQFSMARARPQIESLVPVPVLTSPASAVSKLKRSLGS